jgi:hypothetical protein
MEVVLAVMKVAGCHRMSAHMLKDAILEHFQTKNLFPRGLYVLVCVYKQSDVLRESRANIQKNNLDCKKMNASTD